MRLHQTNQFYTEKERVKKSAKKQGNLYRLLIRQRINIQDLINNFEKKKLKPKDRGGGSNVYC